MGGGLSVPELGRASGRELGVHLCNYLGSVPVKAPSGNDVSSAAIQRLLELKNKEKPVAFIVTTRGLYIVDVKTKDIIKETPIKDVSFVATYPADKTLLCFFENDKHARLITCHTFRAKNSYQIPVTINQAFENLKNGGDMDDEEEEGPPSRRGSKGKLKRQMSKKEAIKASNANKQEFEKGNLIQSYECKFLGFVNVSRPKGQDVVDEAVGRIKQTTAKPIGAKLNVYDKALELTDSKGKMEYHMSFIRDCSFAVNNEDKTEFYYILHDRRLDKMECYALAVTVGEDQPSIRRTIDAAQKVLIQAAKQEQEAKVAEAIMNGTSMEKAEQSVKSTAAEAATGRIIGVFEASYLGSKVVKSVKGQEVVDMTVQQLKKDKKAVPENVFIHVATEGIKTMDSLTHESITSFVMKDISFTAVSGKKAPYMFAYIQKDEALNLINCHVFSCAGERAFDIAEAFNQAFAEFAEEQKKTGGNPFQPFGERVTPRGELFKKQVHRRDLLPRKAIGAGQFGQVYLASQTVAEGTGEDCGNEVRRAVKMLRGAASEEDREEFQHEATVMLEMEHENLVQLIGVAIQQKPWLMVLEFLQYGDLRNVLKGCAARDIKLVYPEQLNYAVQVCAGMAFMAENNFCHMDLAARNVLVHHGNVVKVADFGLTKRINPSKGYWKSDTVMKLPVKWCSIEALDERRFSEASDVWAFGVVLWEIILYGQMPYLGLKTQEVQRRVREGLRLEFPDETPQEFKAIATSCWRKDYEDRPTFSDMHKELSTYLRANADGLARDIGAALKSGSES